MAGDGLPTEPEYGLNINLDLVDPSAHEIIAKLIGMIDNIRLQLATTNQECRKLRAQVENNISDKRRKQPKSKSTTSTPVTNTNAGGSINNNEDNEMKDLEQASTSAAATRTCAPLSTSVNVVQSKKKIIQIVDGNLANVRNGLKNTGCSSFTLRQTYAKAPIKVTISDPEEIPAIQSALKINKISFHEFKWASEKQQGFIIRGMVGAEENDIPGILQQLISQGVPKEAKLSLFITGYMKAQIREKRQVQTSLLKLVVPPNFDPQVLKNIRFLDHIAVTFEPMKSKAVVQCSNCQRFGHTTTGCQHPHRCVKCGANHLRDECERTHDKSKKLVCCNCNGNHSANDLSACTYFKENFAKKEATVKPASKKAQPYMPERLATRPKTAGSYAAVASLASRQVETERQAPRLKTSDSFAGVARLAPQETVYNNKLEALMKSFTDLNSKIDVICQLVLKHDGALQKFTNYE